MTRRYALVWAAALVSTAAAFGQASAIPQLSSRPGAAYTLYLNMGGFSYTGTWAGATPGVVPAYSVDTNTAVYSTAEVANMRQIWSRTAEAYAAYNINVTTTDPAPAGSTDAQRQLYYESTPRVMHSILGGSNAWYSSGAGGVSYVGVAYNGGNPAGNGGVGAGLKTNWTFPANLSGGAPKSVATAAIHEDGHALGLSHQARWNGTTLEASYDNGTSTGNAVAPIMGVAYSTTRGLWRIGATSGNSSVTAQNDVLRIQALTNNGMRFATPTGFADAGIGHTTATATILPVTGTTVNAALAKGVITPLSSTAPNPIGEGNYTRDYFRFTVPAGNTGSVDLALRSGISTITPGTADPGAMLDAVFRLLNGSGATLVSVDAAVLSETLTASNLSAGTYYLQIASHGGFTDVKGYQYFDFGSYFITGTVTFSPVPEPATVLAVAGLGLFAARLRRRAATPVQTAA